MKTQLKVACVQHCAGLDQDANLEILSGLIAEAAAAGAELICLPEYCACYGMRDDALEVGAEPEAGHAALRLLAEQARRHARWLLIGSIAIRLDDGRICNRSYLLDPEGKVQARYDKIHLFDVDLAGGESYRESATIKPGETAVVAPTPLATMGLSVCYDLRFPQLYRAMAQAGAEILFVPAAFTRQTGQAHWHLLLRARAVENACFVIAPSQCGDAEGRLARYGHSLIVDPWGEVLADGGEAEGIVTADIDLGRIATARHRIPALRHDRAFEVTSPAE